MFNFQPVVSILVWSWGLCWAVTVEEGGSKNQILKKKSHPQIWSEAHNFVFLWPCCHCLACDSFCPKVGDHQDHCCLHRPPCQQDDHIIQSLPFLICGRVLAGVCSSVNTANCSMLIAQVAVTIISRMMRTMMRRVMRTMALSVIKFSYLQYSSI